MLRAATLFDSYVMVDWSAAARPRRGKDSIWIGVLDRDPRGRTGGIELHNPPTRAAASALLETCLMARTGRRVLLGIDVALGYPCGFAALLAAAATTTGAPAHGWSAVWSAISTRLVDAPDNANNRFAVAAELNRMVTGRPQEGPFWGAPVRTANGPARHKGAFPLQPGSGPAGGTVPLTEFRHAERLLRAGGWRPLSVWQLLGAGSVGSQTLTAIPVLDRMRNDDRFAGRMRVWPFETGFGDVPAADLADAVVVAETWPGILPPGALVIGGAAPDGTPDVRDALQMWALASRVGDADERATLGAWFAPPLAAADAATAIAEEGWILGCPHPDTADATGSCPPGPRTR